MKVKCINNNGMEWLKLGCIYEVSESLCLNYMIKGHSVLKSRFEIVEDNMKEYTIQEVLEVIEEGQKYKCTRGSYNIKFIEKAKTGIRFIYANKDREALIIGENARFTLVKQDKEVSFMDAMKAYGNIVYCKWVDSYGEKFTTYYEIENEMGMIVDCDELKPMCAKEILEGTWFIKAE